MRTTKSITISLPPEQLRIAERLAKKENRTMSELFREALRRYRQQEEWRPDPVALAQFGRIVQAIQQDAKNAGRDVKSKAEIDAEVKAARKDLRARDRKNTKRSGK